MRLSLTVNGSAALRYMGSADANMAPDGMHLRWVPLQDFSLRLSGLLCLAKGFEANEVHLRSDVSAKTTHSHFTFLLFA
jgi:hypothetical protein